VYCPWLSQHDVTPSAAKPVVQHPLQSYKSGSKQFKSKSAEHFGASVGEDDVGASVGAAVSSTLVGVDVVGSAVTGALDVGASDVGASENGESVPKTTVSGDSVLNGSETGPSVITAGDGMGKMVAQTHGRPLWS